MTKMKVINIPINAIRIKEEHWEREHSSDDIDTIAEEICSVGLINPITVRPDNGHYELLAGRKRFLAMRDVLGKSEIPATLMQVDDVQAELISIYENLGQSDMSQADIDEATKRAVELEAEKSGTGITDKVINTVAARTNQKPAEIKKSVKRENKLIPEAKEALKNGQISKSQANELTRCNRPEQKTMLEEMVEKDLNHQDARDKRLSNRGNKSGDDKENTNVRTAKRMVKKCVELATKLKKELQKLNDFITTNKVQIDKLGGVKNTAPLASVAEELALTRKFLKTKESKTQKEKEEVAALPPSRPRAKRAAARA